MNAVPKLAVFADSTRRTSFNRKLARAAYDLAREREYDANFVALADDPMPRRNGRLLDAVVDKFGDTARRFTP